MEIESNIAGAPTTIVSPSMATADPKDSSSTGSLGVSVAVWVIFVQPAAGLEKTYAASGVAPPPTTIVSPLMATDEPR